MSGQQPADHADTALLALHDARDREQLEGLETFEAGLDPGFEERSRAFLKGLVEVGLNGRAIFRVRAVRGKAGPASRPAASR